jgi:thiamine pyrophosphokinase
MAEPRILIFANGVLPDPEAARLLLQPGDWIICADGGSRHVRTLGLTPRTVIGDLDSLDESDRRSYEAQGVQLLAHPRDKDETDLELALSHALSLGPRSIVIVAALGARVDHMLGNISLLSDSRLDSLDCCLDDGIDRLLICRTSASVDGLPGDLVSLLPWGGAAVGVRTDGLRWALHGETLYPERSRGISNEILHPPARIRLESGALLIVHHRLSQAGGSE